MTSYAKKLHQVLYSPNWFSCLQLLNIKKENNASPHSLLTFSLYILLLQERPIANDPSANNQIVLVSTNEIPQGSQHFTNRSSFATFGFNYMPYFYKDSGHTKAALKL